MLGVRYVIFRGKPDGPSRPAFQSNDYWALENQAALPRAFVPRRVETVTDNSARLEKLGSPNSIRVQLHMWNRPLVFRTIAVVKSRFPMSNLLASAFQ